MSKKRCLEFSGEGVETVAAAGDEHEVGSSGGECAGERCADPGGRSGDEHGLGGAGTDIGTPRSSMGCDGLATSALYAWLALGVN